MKILPLLILAAVAAALLGTPARAEDEFTPIETELVDRAVVMKLPAGVRRIRLRVREGDGRWTTRTIAHLEGSEGYLKLRLPDGVAKETLEVSASWTDPFPYSFYQGATNHAGTESEGMMELSPTFGPQAMEDTTTDDPGAEPVVEESDIWKWRDRTLYFFNQYRGLQVLDVSDPAAPDRLASLRLDSYGEQMYLHPVEDAVILLTHDHATGNGEVALIAHESRHVLHLRDRIPVPGYIIESRLIGNILYVVSRNSWQDRITDAEGIVHVTWRSGLAVTKVDLNDPADPIASPPLQLDSERYNFWGAQVQATSRALLVSTNAYDSARRQSLSTVHVIDISDPAATPTVTHHLPVAGQVLSKFNLRLDGDILTAVSQVWRGGTTNRQRYASVETFDLSRSNPPLDSIEFANNESITATRFVGDLLYVVTFLRIDPLFVLDLSDPSRLSVLSELEIPGFSTYLQPHGEDTLLSIGVEGSQVAVSWFDVTDPTDTSLASRIFIGADDGWSWTEANWDEKALGFFPNDKLLLVPYQGSVPGQGWISGVQLVELGDDELIKRGSFAHEFRARRARVVGDAVVSISGRSLKSLDISDRDHPRLLAELTLAWPADLVHRVGDVLVQLERGPSYFFGPTTSSARLRISPVDDPDELLATLDLPGGRIAGSLVVDDCLFIAQLQVVQEQAEQQVLTSEVFSTTVVDLGGDPDRPIIVGRATHPTGANDSRSGFGSDYRGALLPDGTLVWYPAEQNFSFWFGPVPLSPVADLGGDVIFPWFPTPGRVFTVDIAEKTRPTILAAVDLVTGDGAWPEGEIRLVGDILYHGLQRSETIAQPDGTAKWIARHWLGTLDLGDPAAPVQGDLVKLPGTFEHALATASGGTVLFTSSRRSSRDLDGTYKVEFRVQALAFDGMAAFLIDELVVPDRSYGPQLFEDRFIILAKQVVTGGQAATDLTIYEWRASGAFRELQTLQRASSIHTLGVIDQLLITRGSDLSFIDFADPADPGPASVSFQGFRFWQSIDKIEVHQRAEAYLPLGVFGVQTLDFGGVFDALPPARPPSPGQPPEPEWQHVSLTMLTPTASSGTLLLSALASGEDWVVDDLAAPLGYDAWTRQALALAPTDPVPSFLADTDSDGKSNGWEFFTGTDPADASSVAHLQVSIASTPGGAHFLTGHLQINPHAAASLAVTGEASFDLAHWENSPGTVELMADPFHPGIRVQVAKPLAEQNPAFLRVVLQTASP